jgi:hypothetical protein
MFLARKNGEFRERTLLDLDCTFGAGQPSTTDALDLHSQLERGFQERNPSLELPSPAGGHEDNLVEFRIRHESD